MKHFFVKILRWILKKLAQLTIWRYRPGIIGVTGSVGKTSAKLAIAAVLGGERKVRVSAGNLNNDLGLPLTILGDWSAEELKLVSREEPSGKRRIAKFLFWRKVVCRGLWRILFPKRSAYPEILVLEYGADRPGDLRYLLEVARPNISVITAVGDMPVHVEFYTDPEEVAREKSRLIECLPVAGFAILNYDDETVMDLKDRTRAHLMTFGFAKGAETQVVTFENRSKEDPSAALGARRPPGIAFKLEYGGNSVPVRLYGIFGKAHAYASAAAACVGLIFGMNLIKISEALRSYRPAAGRMELLPGIKFSYLINDCYNASPNSMRAALDTLKSLPAKRKVAVLGDMLEIGKYTMEAHERVGRLAARIVEVLVTVGPRAKFIADAAQKSGLNRKHIYSFDTAEDAIDTVQNLIRKGDLVLVKGSHAMELEKVVEGVKISQ
ncbi:MAG: UDP-N-acetylmuramoyl-tripeptide--D-alanyl-D-alanine ligase [Patescibacteria group bacterium]